jgi:hypothetical protein
MVGKNLNCRNFLIQFFINNSKYKGGIAMKKSIYKIVFTLIVTLLICSCNISKPLIKRSPLDAATDNYLYGLRHQNQGIVESSIYHVLILYSNYPEKDYSLIKAQLNKLAINGPTEIICYKAYLAGKYLNNQELIDKIAKCNYQNQEQFFTLLSENLNGYFLGFKQK